MFWDEVCFYMFWHSVLEVVFLFAFFFLFFQMSILLIFCLNVLSHYLFPFSWLTDVLFLWTYGHSPSNWVQNVKTLNTWKLHSHGLGGVAEWVKMDNLKVLGELEKLWIQNINFPVNKKSFTLSALKNFIFFLLPWELKVAFSFKTEKW